MKIAYVLPYDWGGMPHYTAELANAVSEFAEVVVIGSKAINEEYFSKNVEIIKVFEPIELSMNNIKSIFSLKNINSLISLKKIDIIKEVNPDIVHFPTPLIPPLPLFIFLKRINKNYIIVHTKHGIYSNSSFKIKIFEEFAVNAFEYLIEYNKIIVHTKNDHKVLIKEKNINSDKISVIPYGTFSFFKNYEKECDKEKNTILFFGNIRKYKGLKCLIEATTLISKQIPDIKVIIAGEGDLSEFEKTIYNNPHYEVHNSYIPDEKVSELFNRSEIVVMPYITMSGQSGIIKVAYAFGNPVIATNVGGISEVLEDGISGLLVPPKNPAKLAEAIIYILKNENIKKSIINGVKSKSEELSWSNIAKKHMDVYKTLYEEYKI
ncbi:MAG: glycosyltransferase family 4 protein [Methanobacteriaceae archaeon]|nr:glycosyltransferase family 4 protein [Methanobacteriaceae archaeon]MDO9626629.1 glycosyltransferase family 4 protein [Methanobacteriaceae archaeon]